ncbi:MULTISPECIES: ATP-binding protein [unclassified Variovorax]|uniref:ATP-binding protein n=1 Tax=unclassified Variovorax TaxID=663243 RepID=UPI0008B0DC88|nr:MULTISPECIES: ATP-binding protein [unclassified Variovorax]SEJ11006.1 ATPase family associated with various cellular activities (AAA) [Variovorax sp. OK202]SFC00870.1 ATPase family associated with various cellular activities (AAA) [Variovorax sp. OK212]
MTQNTPLKASDADAVVFLPGARGEDPLAQHWLRQVTLRLRREVCWLWRERTAQVAQVAQMPGDADSALPPFSDRALGTLDLLRYANDKRSFFASDVTARHLGELIAAPAAPVRAGGPRGSFTWLVQALGLTPLERFVLAMALLPVVDSAAGQVIAACLNDPGRTEPTLALAQRLWDEPDDLVRGFDAAHPLLRHGVLSANGQGWHATLAVAGPVARELLFPGHEAPASLQAVPPCSDVAAPPGLRVTAPGARMSLQPLVGVAGAPLAEVAAAACAPAGVPVVQPSPALAREHLQPLLVTAWLRGCAVYLPIELLADGCAHDAHAEPPPLPALPLTVFIGLREREPLRSLGPHALPPVEVPPMTHAERLACWRGALPGVRDETLLGEVARRFRYEREAIHRVGDELAARGIVPTAEALLQAARADLDLGALAQPVVPRFRLDELMLPPEQTRQLGEIVAAMRNLTRVHYEWGTARAWNEGGLAALFSGPPGTGKTMAAEAIANELGLPIYRIDLSQVVNKYIGETEKNLRRLFDAADSADVILFFDEADALFGKRTEVKDAHDRYANLEVSYLLERMERFKGLAILATNRKKDLDEAFLRRLRFVLELPLPGPAERLRIWQGAMPGGVDASALDLPFLAQNFALAGGHIRGIVFQACLQSANEGAPRALGMPAVIRAVHREYAKLERAHSLDQFGPYASLVAAPRSPE